MKVLLLRGLPASGKSTYSKELVSKDHSWVRVNKDGLRAMMNNGEFSSKLEKQIVITERELVENALKIGKNVVVDDTNFNLAHERYFSQLARYYKAEFEVKFFDTPLEECIKRDNKRPNGVGEAVIYKMYDQYLKPQPAIYEHNKNLRTAIICDIDGTLAHMKNRSPYDWSRVDTDEVDPTIKNLLNVLKDKYFIILVSGRDEVCREKTEKWLRGNDITYGMLLMRPEGDIRKDLIIKRELFEIHIRPYYNVEFVLDDRNQVVEMWRSLGLKCLQVQEGDF
nr:MAG TPA: polynucleotide kinase [Caudoviricetes sp.]